MTSEARDIVDTGSECMALATYGNVKNLLLTALELSGPLDERIVRKALIETLHEFPHLSTVLCETRIEGRFQLSRRPVSPDLFRFTLICAPPLVPGRSRLDAFLSCAAQGLDRERNPFKEPPGEFFLVRFGPDDHLAAIALHHCAADPTIAAEFGRLVFFAYHRLMTGEGVETNVGDHSLSTSRKRTAEETRGSRRDQILFAVKQALEPLLTKATFPEGSGVRKDLRQFHPKRTLDEADTERVFRGALRKRSSLVDLLAACANIAVDRWNMRRGKPLGLITTAMTVNMKGRRQSAGFNNSSTLFFKFPPGARTDVIALARAFSIERVGQFKRQHDFKLFETVEKTATFLKILPFRPRRFLFQRIMNRPKFSLGVTFLGVVWPKKTEGRPTGESYPLALGPLTVRDVHGLGYKLLSGTPIVLIAYIFHKRLHLAPAIAASLFTKDESEAFLDEVVAVLRETFSLTGPAITGPPMVTRGTFWPRRASAHGPFRPR